MASSPPLRKPARFALALAFGFLVAGLAFATSTVANHPQTQAGESVAFDHVTGNDWWVETRLTGATGAVSGVAAQDTDGPWVPLTLKPWGVYAASFHIEAGHQVHFRASVDGVVITSCFFSHPSGIEQDCTPGPAGPAGPMGPQGPPGVNGTNGTNGSNGQPGADGANGTNGTNGTNGLNGQPGADGADGTNGTNGVNGTNGAPGATGPAGAHGTNGTNGLNGAPGPAGSTLVLGSIQTTSNNPNAGTQLSATATCAPTKVLLGGGARVTSSLGTSQVAVVASYPSSVSEWTATGRVLVNISASNTMSVQAFALCSL